MGFIKEWLIWYFTPPWRISLTSRYPTWSHYLLWWIEIVFSFYAGWQLGNVIWTW